MVEFLWHARALRGRLIAVSNAIRESRIASFTGRLPGATKRAPTPVASPALAPIPAMSAWKSEALTPLHFARDRVSASRFATARSTWSGASACADPFVFVVPLVDNWNFASLTTPIMPLYVTHVYHLIASCHVDCLRPIGGLLLIFGACYT